MAPASITFFNASQAATSSIWTLGDGTSATQTNPVHTYTQPGTYNVKLVARGVAGCADSVVQTLIITAPDPCLVKAGFRFWIDSINKQQVHFISTSTPPGVIAKTTWSFGDGQGDNSTNPVHVYTDPGSYRVCLQVAKDSSCKATSCDSVVIARRNIPAISVFPNPATTSITLAFNLANGGPIEVQLYEANGQLLKRITMTATSGYNQLPLSVADLSAGMYTIQIVSANSSDLTIRFYKL